ncbi:hypothetical protein [Streptomyces sp. JJ36]|uniref:hypothetical protein n=1 Tax=Streptomyces sp. JJ36 TaxID=2736645 RepID=UPI001F31A219|nr:hypothetical protein [Streptomyces sp. JJ36]MCF6522587.1 hypothetical protein [Streptomyces sp. JJ36]
MEASGGISGGPVAAAVSTENGPALFAGAAFAAFGAALLLWSSRRVLLRRPVAEGAHPVVAATVALAAGAVSLGTGLWLLQAG